MSMTHALLFVFAVLTSAPTKAARLARLQKFQSNADGTVYGVPENRAEQCVGEEAKKSRPSKLLVKRRDRCCLPDWREAPSVDDNEATLHDVYDTHKEKMDNAKAKIKEYTSKGDDAYNAMVRARKEEVTDHPEKFSETMKEAVHQVWVFASTLECARYDLKSIWHRRHKHWNPFSSKSKDAKEMKKDFIDPLRTSIDKAWKWRDRVRSNFNTVFGPKRKLIESESWMRGFAFGYDGSTGQKYYNFSGPFSNSESCIATVYNPVAKRIEIHKSDGGYQGIAAVWNPVSRQVEVRKSTGERSIGGCFDANTQQVVFQEGLSCLWHPIEKKVRWYECPSCWKNRGVMVVGWDAKAQQVVNFSRPGIDGGSVSMLYRTPDDEEEPIKSATACSFSRRRRSRRRTSSGGF